jgi:hypothetical protein
MQDVDLIRKSKEPIRKLAETYNVSFATIWRIKENITYRSSGELICPHCGQGLTPKEIGRLFAALGGSVTSERKRRALAANRRKRLKLTEEDIAYIRQSNSPTRELARKYNVLLETIRRIRREETR